MPWITPTQNTLLKLRPTDSKQLGGNEFRQRNAGDRLGVVAVRKADNNHWQVRLAGDLTIGGTKTRELFIWPGHWDGAAAALAASLDAARTKAISMSAKAPLTVANGVVLNIAYKSQIDNANNPTGSCNVTSSAMCLEYWGVKAKGAGQLEDELYEWLQREGLSRHDPNHLKLAIEAYGCRDDFSTRATIAEIKQAIDNAIPVIVHGYFTTFGHIIVLIGYNDKGFICHDPYGEWTSGGYDRNDEVNPKKGEAIVYSYGLIERTCCPDGGCWAHFVTRLGVQKSSTPPPTAKEGNSPLSTTAVVSRKYSPQDFRLNSIATAMIKSYEGLDLDAYLCSEGIPTIGIGTTVYPDGREVKMGDRCTELEALGYFHRDIDRFMKALRDLVDVSLTGRQIAALTSFIYNCGIGSTTDPDHPGFAGSTLRKLINQSASPDKIQEQFRRWTNSGTEGLIKRRESECELWQGGKWETHR
jgi:GH24 family phage-related lysozyme (muramidase)